MLTKWQKPTAPLPTLRGTRPVTGESSQKHPGPHRIDVLNIRREDIQRTLIGAMPAPQEELEHFKALGLRRPGLADSADLEEFKPSFVQKIIDGERFQNGILENERMPIRALGVAVVVMYAQTAGFIDEIKERIGN